jgi:signal transduction histidine kinase
MITAVRQFLRPVDEAQVPNLRDHLRRSMKLLLVSVLVLLIPSITISTWLLGVPMDYVLGWMAVGFVFAAGTLLVKDDRVAQGFQFVANLCWMTFFLGLGMFPQTRHMVELSFCVLPASALTTPRSPAFFFWLGVGLVILRSLEPLWLPSASQNIIWVLAIAASITVLCMMGVQMVRRLLEDLHKARHQLVASDRLSTLGLHTAGIAHELKTPLASALTEAHGLECLLEELGQSIDHPDVEEGDMREIHRELSGHMRGLRGGLERIAGFVSALRQHTQQMHRHEDIRFRLRDRLELVIRMLQPRLKRSDVALDTSAVPGHLWLRGDAGKFEQVLTNLISNAVEVIDASGQGSRVEVSALQDGQTLRLTVQDDGPGVPREMAERIFEPLFTTRGDKGGTGLGLAVCRDIIEGVFAGTLELVESPQGARFEVCVPVAPRRNPHSPPMAPRRDFVPFDGGSPGA